LLRAGGVRANDSVRASSTARRLTVAFLGLAVLLLSAVGAGRANAHAVLLRSSPAQNARLQSAPASVQLFFSEALDRHGSSVRVLDSSGATVRTGSATFTSDPTEMDLALPPLQPGFFVVSWTTVSAVDGHRLQGSFPFVLLNPDGSTPSGAAAPVSAPALDPAPPFFDSAVRAVLLLALMALAGGGAFALFVLLPAAAEFGAFAEAAAWPAAVARAARLLLWASAIVAVASLIGVWREAEQLGGPGHLLNAIEARVGWLALARTAAALVALVLMRSLRRAEARDRWRWWAAWLAALVALGTMSLASHAAARSGAGWAVPADFVHLLSASVWLGGLIQLPGLLRDVREKAQPRLATFSAAALGRFSSLAALSVAALVMTGLFSATVEVASPRNLGNTHYGVTLIVKASLTAAMLLVALGNAVWLAPRVRRALISGASQREGRADGAAVAALRRSALAEAALGVAVVCVTGVLVWLVPARDAAAGKLARLQPGASASSVYRNTAPAGDLTVALTVTPNRPGENELRAQLSGPDVQNVSRVQFRFQPPNAQLGPSSVDAQPQGGGLYTASVANLSTFGRWQVTINVHRSGHDDVNGAFSVEVPDVSGLALASPAGKRDLWAFPGRGISADQALGFLLVFAGVVLYQARRPLARFGRAPSLAGASLAALSMTGGAMLFFAVHSHGTTGTAPVLTNPVPGDERSLRSGAALYAQDCAVCHGVTGHGDGPEAASLNPKPFDLTVHAGLHPDYQLYDWITNGIPGTAMPAWKGQLDDQQRWDLVNYLRTLSTN
jgi:copper transport protein